MCYDDGEYDSDLAETDYFQILLVPPLRHGLVVFHHLPCDLRLDARQRWVEKDVFGYNAQGDGNALTSDIRPINPIPSLVINGRNKIFYYFSAIDLCLAKGH